MPSGWQRLPSVTLARAVLPAGPRIVGHYTYVFIDGCLMEDLPRGLLAGRHAGARQTDWPTTTTTASIDRGNRGWLPTTQTLKPIALARTKSAAILRR